MKNRLPKEEGEIRVEQKSTKKFKLNISFGIINGVVSALQTFWFILYIKEHLGSEAYGYISVINGIVGTLLVISSAVASMGTRYILVNIGKNNTEEAKRYFNSELVAMIISGISIFLIGILITLNLHSVMNVRPEFYSEVQILFLMTIFSFSLQLLSSPFSASFFYTNELYITYVMYTLDYVTRIVVTIILFSNNLSVLWSAAVATDVVYLVMLLFYVYYSYRKLSELNIDFSYFRLAHLFNLIKSGIWIAVSSAGNMLLSSLNIYFANILCGVLITGVYASIMQFNIVSVMVLTVLVNSLLPKMFKLYSANQTKKLYNYTIYAMHLSTLVLSIISGGIIVFGNDFMGFWMGNDFKGYQLLIFLTVVHLPITLPSQILNQSFTVINKVKMPAIATIVFGVLNLVFALFFTKLLNLGIYGIVTSSLMVQVLRDNVFYPFYFSKITSIYSWKLLSPILSGVFGIIIMICISKIVYTLIAPSTLFLFVIDSVLSGGMGVLILWILSKKNLMKEF
ncbi:hypothetical protein [Leuconostoc citreum]|uniref:hypothetical protein n=1 Tax=Leuconostoc citreum TaxID=33964 RepID=UPI0021A36D27|nr:hypothetical protein [Leuconostoc citreum]MCT3057817.1 hypothetical protein [Leuconostoc citreum]MCT3073636.1 hypothetical protein [Leuconostoc citreum]MDM7641794.1 hypothetical protein [Leuconostoc citreum]